jgi:uncharacterized repeat protein (TIGR03803 family)
VNLKRIPMRLWLLILLLALAPLSSAEWNEKVLHSFQGGNDGSFPGGGVVFDQQGNLYGVTQAGGPPSCAPIGNYCGTVYELSPSAKGGPWTKTLLYMFKGKRYNDGEAPDGLIIDQAGNLYGVTAYGGTGGCVLVGVPAGCGTVYELSPPQSKGGKWTYAVLYSFKGGKDGYLPGGNLVFDSAGNLYGTTDFGGGKGTTCNPYYQYCGTVFKLSPPKTKGGAWTEKVLHSFAGGTDGANPNGGLVLDSKGAVYGATNIGGFNCPHMSNQGCGTVFKLGALAKNDGVWREDILYRFKGFPNDGKLPNGGLILDAGSIYGTTGGGGASSGDGTVFELTPAADGRWVEAIVHTFLDAGDPNGAFPMAGLKVDSNGGFLGTASGGGSNGAGTIFRARPPMQKGGSWEVSVMYPFSGSPDGAYPAADLVVHGAVGHIFGTTQQGGTSGSCQGGCGTVFEGWP